MAREINLVPDIKGEMIKALKLRNFIFFLCIVIASASVAATLVVASIAGGQQAAVDGKKNTLSALSAKVNGYDGLSNFLTFKDQLSNLSSISNNKKLLSRTFTVLQALLPKGPDTIKVSELSIDLSSAKPRISFDAQADAGQEPYFDYRVLDAFVKSMQYMRYDYGNYVDRDGNIIPAYCIVESGANGATLSDPEKGYYAYWLITGDGCNPGAETSSEKEVEEKTEKEEGSETEIVPTTINGYNTETYNGKTVVRIWRTPQFNLWYGKNQMTLDGQISGVEHFASQCITYTGVKNASSSEIKWTKANESCLLVPDGSDGISVPDSSNGRSTAGGLVLRFSASISINPDVYSFKINHVIAFGPDSDIIVTDSYVQIQNMFSQRATDCDDNDTACANKANEGDR